MDSEGMAYYVTYDHFHLFNPLSVTPIQQSAKKPGKLARYNGYSFIGVLFHTFDYN